MRQILCSLLLTFALWPQAPSGDGGAAPRSARASVAITGDREIAIAGTRMTLAELPSNAAIVEAKIASFPSIDAVVIALVVREDQKHTYRFLHDLGLSPAPKWLLSDALFASQGDPFRIVEVMSLHGDSIEITFRRGYPSARGEQPRFEEKIYVDSCPLFKSGGTLIEVTQSRYVTRGR